MLTAYLSRNGYGTAQINKAIHALRAEADNHSRGLYGNNKEVYKLLRYGVPAKIEAGKVTETVHLINWAEPEKNNFAIAEEVTLREVERICCKNSLTIQDVVALASLALLQFVTTMDVAKIFFATDPNSLI